MIRVNKITVQPCYSQVLNEVVKAGIMGNDILMDMLQDASIGDNPSQDEEVNTRPITQEDVKVMAARLAENKKNAQDAENAQNAEWTRQYSRKNRAAVVAGENALRQARLEEAPNAPPPPGAPANQG